jgi:hypothetical protein
VFADDPERIASHKKSAKCQWVGCDVTPTCGPLCDAHTELTITELSAIPLDRLTYGVARALAAFYSSRADQLETESIH